MKLARDSLYIADKGKYFVLTEKGKEECASFRHLIVGEPVSDYDTEACKHSVDSGHVIEVDIPDWVVKEGFEVVYDHDGYTLPAGNATVFPERMLAERYMEHYQGNLYLHEDYYIRDAVYEGRALQECRTYQGRQVFNVSWFYGTSALRIGDYVEKEIVDDIVNCLPPACMRTDCTQLGEPSSHRPDKNGNYRATFETFKYVGDGVWEYCGACFRGENTAA